MGNKTVRTINMIYGPWQASVSGFLIRANYEVVKQMLYKQKVQYSVDEMVYT